MTADRFAPSLAGQLDALASLRGLLDRQAADLARFLGEHGMDDEAGRVSRAPDPIPAQ